jgi:WD40 repeat protein
VAAPGSAELYDPTGDTWTSTGTLHVPRYNHTATLLPNGKVLVAGGQGASTSAEVYDPVAKTWTATTHSMKEPRYNHTATLLPNGKVLVTGGYNTLASTALQSAELYDPASGSWTYTSNPMNVPRYNHTATLLPNGKVLVTGGNGSLAGILQSAELYDPVSGTWTPTNPMNAYRQYHTATLLPNGQVLVAGGNGGGAGILQSAELYDPVSGKWTYTCHLNDPRQYHTASLLPNGTVLVSGGYNGTAALDSAELYDPANCSVSSNPWTLITSTMTGGARYNHTATLLQNGKVLVSGGYSGTAALDSAELYY